MIESGTIRMARLRNAHVTELSWMAMRALRRASATIAARARHARAFVGAKASLRIGRGGERVAERDRVFERLRRALPGVRQHRVRGVAQQRDRPVPQCASGARSISASSRRSCASVRATMARNGSWN